MQPAYDPPPGVPSHGAPSPYPAPGFGPPGQVPGPPAPPPAPLSTSAFLAIALAALALGAERLAYYGSRSMTYPLSVMLGEARPTLSHVGTLAAICGVVVGGILGYALGPRLTGLLGAVVGVLGAVACVVAPGLVGVALIGFGSGVCRPVPLAVIVEEVPASVPGRFRRVAASLAFAYVAVDVAGYSSSLFSTAATRFGLRPAFMLVGACFGVVAALAIVLLVLGPKRHLESDTRLEIVRGQDADPYRAAPTVRAAGPALPLALLGALLGAHLVEVVGTGVAYDPQRAGFGSASMMSIAFGLQTFISLAVTVALGLFYAVTDASARARSVYVFAGGMAATALFALLRIPASGFYPLVALLGFGVVAAQSVAGVVGLAAFASRFPRRAGPAAVAAWILVSMGVPFLMSLVPEHGYAAVAAGLASLLALVGAGVLAGLGKVVQPEEDP